MREIIPVALMDLSKIKNAEEVYPGNLFKYDLSLSVLEWEAFIQNVKDAVLKLGFATNRAAQIGATENKPLLQFCCFGHMGDENLHLNILLRYSNHKILTFFVSFHVTNLLDTRSSDVKSFNLAINDLHDALDNIIYTDISIRNGN